jgi:hypothetical protein
MSTRIESLAEARQSIDRLRLSSRPTGYFVFAWLQCNIVAPCAKSFGKLPTRQRR